MIVGNLALFAMQINRGTTIFVIYSILTYVEWRIGDIQ